MNHYRIIQNPDQTFYIQKLCQKKQNIFQILFKMNKKSFWKNLDCDGKVNFDYPNYPKAYRELDEAEKALEIIKGNGIIKYYK